MENKLVSKIEGKLIQLVIETHDAVYGQSRRFNTGAEVLYSGQKGPTKFSDTWCSSSGCCAACSSGCGGSCRAVFGKKSSS